MYKRAVNFRVILWVIPIVCLIFILYVRFQEAVIRSYGPDEYTHLHYVYLLTTGKLPFRDFFNIYSPIFHMTLYPVFGILGQSYRVFAASRVVVFFFFLATLIFTYGIGNLIGGKKIALISVLIAAVLPIGVEKALEIRPDNLMTMLCIGGVYFFIAGLKYGKNVSFILSGIFFTLSFLTLAKIVFSIGAFLFGGLLFLFTSNQIRLNWKKAAISFFLSTSFVAGLFFFVLFILGIAPAAVESMYSYSRMVVSGLRFGYDLHPFYWFAPNDAVYGTYRGFAWYTNTILFLLLIVGIITTGVAYMRQKSISSRWLLFFPMMISFLYLYIVPRAFLQYLLPFLLFVPFWSAFGVYDLVTFLSKKLAWVSSILLIGFYILLTFSVWDSWQVKKWWADGYDREFIQYILTHTQKTDVFWGREAQYVFRPDGYFVYHSGLLEFPTFLQKKFPPLVATLEKKHTKYLLVATDGLVNRTWPYDQPYLDEFVTWAKKNFQPSDYPNLWIRKS